MERSKRPRRKRPEGLDVVTVTSEDVEGMFAAADGWQETLYLAVLAHMGARRTAASTSAAEISTLNKGTIRFFEKGGKVAIRLMPDKPCLRPNAVMPPAGFEPALPP